MSFASVTGSSIGQRSTFYFNGIDEGLNMGVSVTPLTIVPTQGTYIFSTSFGVYSGSAIDQEHSLQATTTVLYKGQIIGIFRINHQVKEAVCMTGLLFSDGVSNLEIIVNTKNAEEGGSSSAWGFADGTLDLIRITDR